MRVLCLCLGNICRSPTAEAVLRAKASERGTAIALDSAGTGDWHVGSPPDRRAQAAALRRGYDMSALRARQLTRDDFDAFDLILAMDAQNERDALRLLPSGVACRVERFLDYAGIGGDVPDPWFTGGFDAVLDLIERAAEVTLDRLSTERLKY